LPYQERHFEALDCATCHVARLYNAAYQELDWTALHLDGSPRQVARGLEGPAGSLHSLVTGYQPIWLPEQRAEGSRQIAPFNLVTTWSWVHGESAQPVSRAALQAAWLDGAAYPPEVLATFDADGSGDLSDAELALDSQDKVQLISRRLAAQGLADPRLVGQVQPYRLSHGVAGGEWAVRECTACHASDSRLAQPMLLSTSAPGGAQPALDAGTLELAGGQLVKGQDGSLYYRPAVAAAGRYILGHNRVAWIDLFGSLAFAGALLGVVAHSSLRFLAALRRPRPLGALQRVYMYSVYERFWHWLQTFTILGLLFTGLVIHKPETFGIFSFRGVVLAHNALAAVVVINAALSLFYHLVSGEIRQYIPRPVGFYDQAILQARYYLRGIFKHEAHPFEKTPDKKLNPLQQLTYFGLLNVLLPLQVITGALMWGAQRWPRLTESLGGLPFLAPFHALIAWLFAAFIVGHVYLTTTGHTPLASIQAMMMGWDEIETPVPAEEVL
jgi:thiosulfate reductase cytochrome b subunit